MGRLSQKYSSVQFLRLDCEALPQVAMNDRYRVKGLPYVIFLKKGAIEDRMDTDSVERIEQTIMRLVSALSSFPA